MAVGNAFSLHVSRAGAADDTVTVLTTSESSALFGESITWTAMVTAQSGVHTGEVLFRLDGTSLGTVAPDPAGQATLAPSGIGSVYSARPDPDRRPLERQVPRAPEPELLGRDVRLTEAERDAAASFAMLLSTSRTSVRIEISDKC